MEKNDFSKIVQNYVKQKGLPPHLAVTFADVFIVDQKSRIRSRADIKNLSTTLAKTIRLNIPIVSANMADITESKMATAIARLGGLGFIHQFMPIKRRVAEVKKVKRADNQIIENPWTVNEHDSLESALNLMKEKQVSGLLVTNHAGTLVGLLTSRDVRFLPHIHGENIQNFLVKHAMSSGKIITADSKIGIHKAMELLHKYRIEKLPIVDDYGKPIGLITSKDILKKTQFPGALYDKQGRLMVGATVGVSKNVANEVDELVAAGADMILVDTARANSERTEEVIREIRKRFPNIPLASGNVDNPEGALLLIEAGVDCIKVGIGPGSACKTRTETGVGVPQLSAIAECAAVAKKMGVSVIADGGIKDGGDFAKALVAGADAVMLGGLLAGTEETPGEIVNDSGELFKVYRGSAGIDTQLARMDEGDLDRIRAPEGVTRKVPYKGQKVEDVVKRLTENLRSSMSYTNAFSIAEFQTKRFRMQTPAGYLEGKPQE